MGIVKSAAKMARIEPQTHYIWMKRDKRYAERAKEVGETQTDFVESKLMQLINEGNPAAIIFYMKTKGKNRGYTERTEITGKDGEGLLTGVTVNVISKREEND